MNKAISLRAVVGVVGVLLGPAVVMAQDRPIEQGVSGAERRESATRRDSSFERRDRQRLADKTLDKSLDYFRLGPSVNSTDGSTSFGVAMHYVHDTTTSQRLDGMGYLTVRPSYRTIRALADRTHTTGYGVGADVQLNKNSHLVQFIASADYLAVRDRYRFASAGLEADVSFLKHFTAIATLGYARLSPNEADSVSDVVPGIALDFVTPTSTPVRLSAEYTFDNSVDQEDDYAVAMRIRIGDKGAVRLGTGKAGRVFVSYTQTLDK